MASFITLPNELKDLIFVHLSSPDFINLSATCKALHKIVLPLAYHQIALIWDNAPGQRKKAPKLQNLLRNLVQRPDLAILVKKLTFEDKHCLYFSDEGRFRLSIPGSAIELIIRYEVYFDSDYGEELSDLVCITSGRLGSFRSYQHLTHLEISLHVLYGSEDSLEGRFYSLADVLPPRLQMLIVMDDLYGFMDWQQYFEDDDAMKIFRKYLTGEDGEGDWRKATPELKRVVYDLRNRGDYTVRFWDKVETREELRALCEGQGIVGEVLWEGEVGEDD